MSQNFEVDEQTRQTLPNRVKMPPPAAIEDYSRPATPENTNGLTTPRTPRTQRETGLSLTEYTANPSPPSEDQKSKAQSAIPEAFLLPNGYPDVGYENIQHCIEARPGMLTHYIVSTIDPHIPRLRSRHRDTPHACHQPLQSPRMQRSPQTRRSPARVQLQAARCIQ